MHPRQLNESEEVLRRASVLRFAFPVLPVGGNHQGADLAEIGTESITVVGLTTDQPLGKIEAEGSVECVLGLPRMSGSSWLSMKK